MNVSDLVAHTRNLALMLVFLNGSTPDKIFALMLAFLNGTIPEEILTAIETNSENPFFVFTLGIIYLKTGATRTFPLRLAELIYHHCHYIANRNINGANEFLQTLDEAHRQKKIPRSLYGLLSNMTPKNFESFLAERNSSPAMIRLWLSMNVPTLNQLFLLFERFQKNWSEFDDCVNLLLLNKTQILFHPVSGCFAVLKKKPSILKLLSLFEIDWEFTFGEIVNIRDFLREFPIYSSILIGKDISVRCSRNLIDRILGQRNCLDDDTGKLTKDVLVRNMMHFHEYLILDEWILFEVFRQNSFVFNTLLDPKRYSVHNVFHFFANLFAGGEHRDLFTSGMVAIKTYGNNLSSEQISSLPEIMQDIHPDYSNEIPIWFALMCIERQERIPGLEDYILLFNAIFQRNGASRIQVVPQSPAYFNLVVENLRKILPDFILGLMLISVTWQDSGVPKEAQFLPVLQTKQFVLPRLVMTFFNTNINLFPVMLQILHLSKTKAELFQSIPLVIRYSDQKAQLLAANDTEFLEIMFQMFEMMDTVFKRFAISQTDFSQQIYDLLSNCATDRIFEAFISDPRFCHLADSIHAEREITRLTEECRNHLPKIPSGSTLADSQAQLGICVSECPVCRSIVPLHYTVIMNCGHSVCQGCSLNLTSCPNCQGKKIIQFVNLNLLDIKLCSIASSGSGGGGCASMPPPAKKGKNE